MIRAAVCDDERGVREELCGYLEELKETTEEGMEYNCFQNKEEIVCEMEGNWQYDIVFLDIELGEDNGIEIARWIRARYPGTVIIFITGHEQYVYECFQVQPLDFLRKPLGQKAVESAFARAIKLCDTDDVWEYTFRDCFYRVFLAEICYFASDRRKVVLYTRTGEQAY